MLVYLYRWTDEWPNLSCTTSIDEINELAENALVAHYSIGGRLLVCIICNVKTVDQYFRGDGDLFKGPDNYDFWIEHIHWTT